MPIYEYRCEQRHTHEDLRKFEDRDGITTCPECQQPCVRILSAHHKQPDGLYSYDPPIGDPAKFERNLAGIAKLKDRMAEKKDRGHPR